METGLYNPKNKKTLILPLIFEFFGTALVTYSFGLGQQSPSVRGSAYFIGWIIASQISGAHYNPAITMAVFIYEMKKSNFIYCLACIIVQLFGAFFGIGISYLLSKFSESGMAPDATIKSDNQLLYFTEDGTPYYLRILLIEFLQTFTFVSVVLIIKYKKSLRDVNEGIKGIAVTITLITCYIFTLGDGSSLNPWFGFAQSMLSIAENKSRGFEDDTSAKVFWTYMLGPAIAGIVAGFVQIFHHKVESMTFDESQQRQSDFSNISRPTYGQNLNVQTLLGSSKIVASSGYRENTQSSRQREQQ